MLRIARGGLLMILATGLSACAPLSQESLKEQQAVTVSVPIATHALGGGSLISYDVFAEGDVLHALFAVAGAESKRPHIAYIRSGDGGRHWSAPLDIEQPLTETVESSAGNEIQIAAVGEQLLAIWQVTGEIPGMGPLRVWYSLDGGQHWSHGVNPTASEGDQSHPDLIADRQGRFHLVWLDDRDENGYQGLRYARTSDAGQHWELAQTIDESSCSCCWNRLLLGPDEQVNVLYRDMEPRDMALAQSGDAGQTWRHVATVGQFNWVFDGCPHNGGALASTDAQNLHALVWTGAENRSGLYYLRSKDNGENWTPPQAMGAESLAFHSDIAAVQDGARLMAIWDARGAAGSSVMISESVDQGEHWSAVKQISTPGSSAEFPRIVATPSGFLALWFEQKPGGSKQWMSAIIE